MTNVSRQEVILALGPFKNPTEKEVYAAVSKQFKQMPIPSDGDWLYSHPEQHQAYADYKLPNYNKVTKERKTIYLQQFGAFNAHFIERLVDFCSAFYPLLDVKCLPVLDFSKELGEIRNRKHTYGKQYLAQDILAYMERNVPKDAYCVMGITLEDIYPGANWNFVYGWAKYKARVGIFSFVRWDQQFAEKKNAEIDWDLILYPSMRTMVHEIGHMFGVTHCVYYRCLMNGFNNIEENYLNPMEFCPICYRKIIGNIQFNSQKRYTRLLQCLKALGIKQTEKDTSFYQLLKEIWGVHQFKTGVPLASKEAPIPNMAHQANKVVISKVPATRVSAVKPHSSVIKDKPNFQSRGKSVQSTVKRK